MKSRSRASAPTTVKRTVPPGRLPNAEYRTREYLTEREVERLMGAGQVSALFCIFLCRPQQIEVTDTQRDRYFVYGDHRGIAVTALKTANVLLAKARDI
jgi:hypothetical protein